MSHNKPQIFILSLPHTTTSTGNPNLVYIDYVGVKLKPEVLR